MRLAGKVAVVTGAGAGMGRAIAHLFAQEGAKVVLGEIAPERLDAVVKEIKELDGQVTGVVGNVAKSEDAEALIQTAIDTYGKIDMSDWNLLELNALKSRGGNQQIAKLKKIQRRQRFDDVDLLNQHALNGLDSRQSMQDDSHVFVFDDRVIKEVDNRLQLEKDLLEPQFVSLVRDDKQHLIVRWFTDLFALQFLRVRDFIKLQVFSVVNTGFDGHRGPVVN